MLTVIQASYCASASKLGDLGVGDEARLGLAEDAHRHGMAQDPDEELLVLLDLLSEGGEGDFPKGGNEGGDVISADCL